MTLNPDLLAILACPQCKQPVEPTPDESWLVCRPCGLRYPMEDGIPIMLVDEASPLEE